MELALLQARQTSALAPSTRALIGAFFQGVGFTLVVAVRDGATPLLWRGPGSLDALAATFVFAVSLGAVILVAFSIRTLGRQWAIRARTIEHHQLITSGPYAVIRHPIYVAISGPMLVIGLAFAPLWAVGLAAVAYAIGTIVRAGAEDKLMAATFGPEFEAYRDRVPGLIPRWR